MKFKYTLALLATIILFTVTLSSQDTQGYPYTGWVYGDGQLCENADVQLVVRFVNLIDQSEVYKESHSTMANEQGQFTVDISKGQVENGEFDRDYLTDPRYKMVIDMIIDCDGEELVVVDRDVSRPRVPIAEEAENWGDQPAPDPDAEPITLKELFAGAFGFYPPVFTEGEEGVDTRKIDGLEMLEDVTPDKLCEHTQSNEPMEPGEVKDALENDPGGKDILLDILGNRYTYGANGLIPVSTYPENAPINYNINKAMSKQGDELTVLTTPEGLNKPNIIRSNTKNVEDHESLILYKFLEIGELFHAFEVFLCLEEEDRPRSSTNHNTAAIFANNPNGTTGILANGSGFGSFSQGQNGAFGVTLNENVSGAGLWGTIGFQPPAENFGYGVLADAQGVPSSLQAWALAIFGDSFITGEQVTASDARLKTEVRAVPKGLETVMALRPAKYRFIENSEFGLPEGEHYGFIAQEVESVLPELVSDVRLPSSRNENVISEGSEMIKAVNYTEIIPILTQAIQDLNAKVDSQTQEIETLKKLIHELQND